MIKKKNKEKQTLNKINLCICFVLCINCENDVLSCIVDWSIKNKKMYFLYFLRQKFENFYYNSIASYSDRHTFFEIDSFFFSLLFLLFLPLNNQLSKFHSNKCNLTCWPIEIIENKFSLKTRIFVFFLSCMGRPVNVTHY